jgi:hypothetical protein
VLRAWPPAWPSAPGPKVGRGVPASASPSSGFLVAASPWSPVVDELDPLIIRSCGSIPKLAVTCVFGSQQFSSLHAMFGAHVPRMCPARAFSVSSSARPGRATYQH